MSTSTSKSARVYFRVTPDELSAIRAEAKRRGVTVSQLSGQVVMHAVLKDGGERHVANQMVFEEVSRFRKLFCRVMYRSLSGTLKKEDIERLEKEGA